MQAWRLYLRDDKGVPENHCRNKDLFLSSSTFLIEDPGFFFLLRP